MKKLMIILLITISAVVLSGCTGGTQKEKPDLDAIYADTELSQQLYNEVCFNQYNKSTKWGKQHYEYIGVQCYYINVNDYDTELKDVTLDVFATKTFYGIPSKSLTKIGVRHNVNEYNAYNSSVTAIKPFCRVDDDSYSTCLSNEWYVKGGVSERYALINLIN